MQGVSQQISHVYTLEFAGPDQRHDQKPKNAHRNGESEKDIKCHGLHPINRAHRKGAKYEPGKADNKIQNVWHRNAPNGFRTLLSPLSP